MDTGLYIDGRETYSTWGVRMLDGSLGSAVCWPPLKESSVPVNDWPEEDGIEADLSNPVLDTRSVTLHLSTDGTYSGYRGFVTYLGASVYHDVHIGPVDRTFRLRLVRWGDYDYGQRLGFVDVTLADDYPLAGYQYEEPGIAGPDWYVLPYTLPFVLGDMTVPDGAVLIDGRPLSRYGVHLLAGTESSLWTQGAVKPALSRSLSSAPGVEYDSLAQVRTAAPRVGLVCLMRADGPEQMWRQWYAMLFELSRPGIHTLGGGAIATERGCYYIGCAVRECCIDDLQGVWIKFVVTLQMLEPLPLDESDTEWHGLPYILPFTLG